MRNAKKLAGLLLALAMLLTLPVNVFAAGEGSITIDNAVVYAIRCMATTVFPLPAGPLINKSRLLMLLIIWF